MVNTADQRNEPAIGVDVITTKHGSNVVFRNYIVERPAHSKTLRGVEAVLDITITLSRPVREVWPVFKDFNLWMNRFGYAWDGLPADNENHYVYLGNTRSSNNLKYGSEGSKTKYVVRKVIPEQLMYWDSLPVPLVDKDGVWTGHNLVGMQEANGQTRLSIFMEHTWYSETMTVEELRAEARWAMFDAVLAFWRDYFIPDLISLLETGRVVEV